MRDTSAITWRHLPALVLTAPGRCRLRRRMLTPVEPVLWRAAGLRRRLLPASHQLIAVTGSFGKTTTARAVRCALGLPVGITAGPNSGDALARAAIAIRTGAPTSVFEVGIGRPGQMAPMARALRPTIVVVTSIGSEHSASLSTLERTREEKFALVLAAGASGTAVLNGDDPHVRWMAERAPGRTITFGFGAGNDLRAEALTLDWPRGMRLAIRAGDWSGTAQVRLIGAHMAGSILAAVAAAWAAGVDRDTALQRLAELAPTPGRMQIVALANGAHLLRDEYKSGLETIDRALEVFAAIPATRRIAVLGEITEPPSPQRQQYVAVGQRVAPLVDRAIVIGKMFTGYRTGLRRGGLPADRIVDAGRSWRQAYEALVGTLGPGDVVLIKGRHDERLERVALALMGEPVRCDLVVCNTPLGRCDTCPVRSTGWGALHPTV